MALKPVYYIYGTDDYLVSEAVREIKSGALKGGLESMNYQAFDGKGLTASAVVAAASTLPAFSGMRMVLVRGADSIKAAEEKELIEYAKDPLKSTCLVFVGGAKADRSTAFIKCLNDLGSLKACNRLSDRELSGWIKTEAARQGKTITDGAAAKLIAIAGNNLRDIKGELDKIILFAGEKAEVDARDVEDAGLDCREETIFGLSDAIGAKDLKTALKIFDKVSGEEPIKVLGAVSRQIRVLLKIKALLRKKVGSQKMPSMLGVPPFALESYLKRSRRFTEKELKGAIRKLAEADIDLKTGRKPQTVVLSKLIIDLSTPGA
ncbi:MAG: DNA polymerase III subunit delta [Deltaproteobacteria bacterium]|nr:DNA polymerase III subunit delta [Deltaproteobacteria bacterium]